MHSRKSYKLLLIQLRPRELCGLICVMASPVQALLRLRSSDEADFESKKPACTKSKTDTSYQSSLRKASESSSGKAAEERNAPTKPLRPLSAYHVFFQLEREYILQSKASNDTETSKILLKNAPRRYKNVKVFPDWHARPGKRQRRKHRKSHGQIGFQELSKAISKRWAEIDKTDPDVKSFVQKIAQLELEQYQRDMKLYKDLTKDLPQEKKKAAKASKGKKPSATQRKSSPSLVSQDGDIHEEGKVAEAALLLMQVSVDKCYVCKKKGELLACELCNKFYHAACLGLDTYDSPFQCSSCSASKSKACISSKKRKSK